MDSEFITMKYQAIRSLKTKNKVLKICDTLKEAHEVIIADGGNFMEFSYYGGFPVYVNTVTKKVWNIQGLAEGMGIVCSLNKEELSAFDFS